MTGELVTMDGSGDTKVIWSVGNADEEAAARGLFDSLKARGYLAYKVQGKEGERGEVIRSFDKTAGRIIMGPPMQGG